MENAGTPAPLTLHVYCRIDVVVTDPRAVRDHAVSELRGADIDWSAEEDDLDAATAQLRADTAASLDVVVDISRMLDGVPGVEFRGGRSWVEPGPPRADFNPVPR